MIDFKEIAGDISIALGLSGMENKVSFFDDYSSIDFKEFDILLKVVEDGRIIVQRYGHDHYEKFHGPDAVEKGVFDASFIYFIQKNKQEYKGEELANKAVEFAFMVSSYFKP